MFGKKKKEDDIGLPDLPPLKEPMNLGRSRYEEEYEKHNLPTFPDSPEEPGFSQSAIKDAVRTEEFQRIPEHPVREINTIEMEEWNPEDHDKIIPSPPDIREIPYSQRSSDLFVKLDKFNSAKKTLSNIQDKLEEITSLLNKIRETKLREEQELSSWEKDVMSIKAEVHDVTENIFEKLE